MSTHLGFRRATRKRLRRCAHVRMSSCRDFKSSGIAVECPDCGSRIVIQDVYTHAYALAASNPTAMREMMPERIAR